MSEDTRDDEEDFYEGMEQSGWEQLAWEQSEWEEWRQADYAQRYREYRSGLAC